MEEWGTQSEVWHFQSLGLGITVEESITMKSLGLAGGEGVRGLIVRVGL